MSQSSALRFEDLTEEAAQVADASLIVRARFVEAADTMLHIDVKGLQPARLKAFWPEIIQEYREIKLRYRPSSEAISRAEEVMFGWMLDLVKDDSRRILLNKWSICLAAPHIVGSFRNYCSQKRLIRRTAERHLHQEFSSIGNAILKSAQSLHEPDWSRVSPMMPNSATDLDKMRSPVVEYDLYGGMKPNFDPANSDDAKARSDLIKRLERANRQRDKKRRETVA
jgi:hypothetical protein